MYVYLVFTEMHINRTYSGVLKSFKKYTLYYVFFEKQIWNRIVNNNFSNLQQILVRLN